ncbi:MAG: tetratricopeptide repeat protein [Acidiferrobacterales bacterium]
MPTDSASNSPLIFDGTEENFEALVLGNSTLGPVLVNYWSPKAGPCLRLYPVLDKLVHEFGGKFLLVNVNTDKHRRAGRDYGVTSVPTLKLFLYRKVAETVYGYQPEHELRSVLNKYVARDSDAVLAHALRTYNDGDTNRGLVLLAKAAIADPEDMRIPLTLAKLLMQQRRPEQAYQLLSSLPKEKRALPEIRDLLTHAGFVATAQGAPDKRILEQAIEADGADLEARYQLSALTLVENDYEGAMEQLLEIMRRDRRFRDGVGRNGLLALFGIWTIKDHWLSGIVH